MKLIAVILLSMAVVLPVIAKSSHSVRGHVTKGGKYVPPHRATDPDKSKSNNWSQKGNVNPYTGKEGSKKD